MPQMSPMFWALLFILFTLLFLFFNVINYFNFSISLKSKTSSINKNKINCLNWKW